MYEKCQAAEFRITKIANVNSKVKEGKKCSDPRTPESADATTKANTIRVKYNRNFIGKSLLHILYTRKLCSNDYSSTPVLLEKKSDVF